MALNILSNTLKTINRRFWAKIKQWESNKGKYKVNLKLG